MIILVHSETTAATVATRLGQAEYSYYFVLRSFLPVLERIGVVVPIADVRRDADRIWRNAASCGQDCVLLRFAPPHRTEIGIECPSILVFAWEFDTIPHEVWSGDRRDDWVWVLRRIGRAIVHSRATAETVRAALGADFPVVSIPSPLWDRFAPFARAQDAPIARAQDAPITLPQDAPAGAATLTVRGAAIDSAMMDFAAFAGDVDWMEVAAGAAGAGRLVRLDLHGVVYTSVFNPEDGRKNFSDMVASFCRVFEHEPDATLVLKLTHHDGTRGLAMLLHLLWRLAPFACRVVLIDGFLDDAGYASLVRATRYVVNTAHGEGQCLPLMEFMSAGKPAIAPSHTGMSDYLSASCAFLVAASREPTFWPQDTRRALRAFRWRIDAASLDRAYGESFAVARDRPETYEAMSRAATLSLQAHCSAGAAEASLRTAIDGALQSQRKVA